MADAKKTPHTLKKASLTMRLPKELYADLSASAERELLSVSAEAERRLKRTFHEDDAAGDPRLSALLRFMASGSAFAIQTHGDLKRSENARREVHEIWLEAVERFLPAVTKMDRPPQDVRKLIDERRKLQFYFKRDRESRGLNPFPERHIEGVDFKGGKFEVKDGHLVGGALDALEEEYAKQILDPSPEEARWAEISDQIAIINQKRRSAPAEKTGAMVKLVQAMLQELTPKERQAVLNDLAEK